MKTNRGQKKGEKENLSFVLNRLAFFIYPISPLILSYRFFFNLTPSEHTLACTSTLPASSPFSSFLYPTIILINPPQVPSLLHPLLQIAHDNIYISCMYIQYLDIPQPWALNQPNQPPLRYIYIIKRRYIDVSVYHLTHLSALFVPPSGQQTYLTYPHIEKWLSRSQKTYSDSAYDQLMTTNHIQIKIYPSLPFFILREPTTKRT